MQKPFKYRRFEFVMTLPSVAINYGAVFVSAVAGMIIGAIWYSPSVFGKIWMKGSKISSQKISKAKNKGMGKLYLIAFLGSIVMACVLASFLAYVAATTVSDALELSLWIWAGFVLPLLLGGTLWKRESWGAYLVNVVYQLVNIVVMSIILTLWV
jgi:hypothetical protein